MCVEDKLLQHLDMGLKVRGEVDIEPGTAAFHIVAEEAVDHEGKQLLFEPQASLEGNQG